MSEQTDTLLRKLTQFGLQEEDAQIYIYLLKNGPSAALRISRDLHISRTKVYRKLDNLLSKKLVVQNLRDRGFEFEAEHPKNLALLVEEKKREVIGLDLIYSDTVSELLSLPSVDLQAGNIKYYKGISGLEQVTWNSLKATKELCIYEMFQDMSKFLSKEFAEDFRKECVQRRIHTQQLTNLTATKPYTKVSAYVEKYWELRHINPKTLKISYEVLIYNDVVAQYSMRGKDIFCVEIHDRRLAGMQRDIFKFVWANAVQMKILSSSGRAKL